VSYRRKYSGRTKGRGVRPPVNPYASPGTMAPPTIRFELEDLCDDCPPLLPIKSPDLGYMATYIVFRQASVTQPPAISASFKIPGEDRNHLSVSYTSPNRDVPSNDALMQEALYAARKCRGPIPNSLGALACSASALGLKCRLLAQAPEELPHPELLPQSEEQTSQTLGIGRTQS